MRTTIDLDEGLLEWLRRHVPPRRLSRFVNEAVAEKVGALQRQEIEARMREGYIATREERAELNKDWSVVDVEGWPD